MGHLASPRWGCPIRRSPDHSLLAAPRGFSQPSTSFIGSWCQGIHRAPLLARRLDLSNSPSRQDQRSQKDTIKNLYVLSAQIQPRLSHTLPATESDACSTTLQFFRYRTGCSLERRSWRLDLLQVRKAPRPALQFVCFLSAVWTQKWPDASSSHVAYTTIRQRNPMRLATPACG